MGQHCRWHTQTVRLRIAPLLKLDVYKHTFQRKTFSCRLSALVFLLERVSNYFDVYSDKFKMCKERLIISYQKSNNNICVLYIIMVMIIEINYLISDNKYLNTTFATFTSRQQTTNKLTTYLTLSRSGYPFWS